MMTYLTPSRAFIMTLVAGFFLYILLMAITGVEPVGILFNILFP